MQSSNDLHYELTWVHVSDIHETGRPGAEDQHRRLIFQRLLEDLDRRSEVGAPDPTLVLVTGDVAMTGGAANPGEYSQAADFLRSLANSLGPGTRLLVVPGNHDVHRATSDDASMIRMLRSAREGDEKIDDLLVRALDMQQLESRLSGYQDFIALLTDLDPEVSAGSTVTGWSRNIESRTLSVRFVGLNTALLANDDNDEGRLQLGYTQMRTATANASADVVMVLLTHHPLSWLRDCDELTPVLTEYFDLHLYGHLHLPASHRSGLLRQRSLISIGAGATYHGLAGAGVGAGEYAYAICSLGWSMAGDLQLRVWPRIWSTRAGRWGADQAILDAGSSYGTYPVHGHSRDPATLDTASESLTAWGSWSSRTIRGFGHRRTAYPLDLTIGELFERGVNIETRVGNYIPGNTEPGQPLPATIVADLDTPGSTLLLGEPGAGKSVGAYEVSRALASAGVLPVVLRASEFKALLSPGHEYAEVMSKALVEADSWKSKVALIIDGLDEMTGSTNSITLAGDFIKAAASVMTIVATCRRREFEEEISRWMPNSTFDRILSVKEWAVTEEFSDYVRKLVAAHLLDSTDILKVVQGSSALKELAARPLFARMLTYVGVDDSSAVQSATGLYARYLNRLASSCAASLREAGVNEVADPMEIWESAARITFENGLIVDEELNYSAAELLVSKEQHLAGPVVRRAMAYVLDIRDRGPVRYGQFVHYSFFEYLVASSLQRQLAADQSGVAAVNLTRRLQHDLPRRVRHFLTELLRPSASHATGSAFVSAYRYARDTDFRVPVRRTICNLTAYVLSRSFSGEPQLLTALLLDEEDPFLRNSLLWALCHAGDELGAVTFVRELDNSAARRQMNRGYLLYYHGDLSRESEPPFMDGAPLRSWSFTRGEVLEMMSDPKYGSAVRPTRQAIDLYTFFDFCISRGEVIRGERGALLYKLVENLWMADSLPQEVASRLLGQVALCTASEQAD